MNQLKLGQRIGLVLTAVVACAAAKAATVTEWNFGNVAANAKNTYTLSPAPTTGSGTASALGMANNYTYTTNGVSTGMGAVNGDDVTNDSPSGTANGSTLGNGDVWRIRGVAGTGTTGTTNNGWNISAPQYSQGAEFDVNTTGFSNIALSFNWAATTQGVGNLQVQYTTGNNVWTNIGGLITATIDNNTTGTTGSGFVTDSVNFSGISAANNDASFGVRLVSAYNPTLGNEYASATSLVSGNPAQINNDSGNWRIADVAISGTAAPVPLPATAWLLLSGLGGLGALARKRKAS